MKRYSFAALASLAVAFGAAGCEQGMETEYQDVPEAQQPEVPQGAPEGAAEEPKDAGEAATEGQETVPEETGDIEDTPGAEAVQEEERETEDAARDQTP